jgi:hypothetical protein
VFRHDSAPCATEDVAHKKNVQKSSSQLLAFSF